MPTPSFVVTRTRGRCRRARHVTHRETETAGSTGSGLRVDKGCEVGEDDGAAPRGALEAGEGAHPLRAVKPSLTRGGRPPTMRARRVRLLFVNANRSRSFGGVERWMIDAASGLAARGHRAALLGRPGTSWLGAGARAGVPVRYVIRGAWSQRGLRAGPSHRSVAADY